jgi:hypothetical protein
MRIRNTPAFPRLCLVELTPVDAFLPLWCNDQGKTCVKTIFNSLLGLQVILVAGRGLPHLKKLYLPGDESLSFK